MALSVHSGGLLTLERGEDYDLSFDYSAPGKLPPNATVLSAEFFASVVSKPLLTTELTAGISAGASACAVPVDVGRGALLTIDAGGALEEQVLVSSVAGSQLWQLTIIPVTWHAHGPQAVIEYELGVTARILGSASGIATGNIVAVHLFAGAPGQSHRVTCRTLLSTGRHLRDSVIVSVR